MGKQQKTYYLANSEKLKARFRASGADIKRSVFLHYAIDGEIRCKECCMDDIDVLNIDHINGKGDLERKRRGSGNTFYRWLKSNNYPTGYQILCANCNLKKEILRRRNKIKAENTQYIEKEGGEK